LSEATPPVDAAHIRTPEAVPQKPAQNIAMPSTYTSPHYHFVFATKGRSLIIDPEWESRLHGYLVRTAEGLGAKNLATNGMEDHVHMLLGLKPTHCVSDFIRDLKKNSSSWLHDQRLSGEFSWQEGYGAFGVSSEGVPGLREYIASQKEHHKRLARETNSFCFARKPGLRSTCAISNSLVAPPPGCGMELTSFRRCRFAQPPATRA
jgi:REP element-mobilizing transposase RayT